LEGNCEQQALEQPGTADYLPRMLAPLTEAVQPLPGPLEDRLASRRRIAIIPALNEAETIGRVIQEIRNVDPGFEILVVDDGSDDGTGEIAETAGARLLRLPFNLGIGGAVQTGYRYALANGFDIAVQIDGDGQHDPGQLHLILEPLVAGDADIVIGSRFAGAGSYRAARFRRVGMRVFASIVSMIVRQPLTDTSSSFRALNRRSLSLFASDYPHGFLETVEATVLAGKYHLRLQEVPVTMRERELGRSSLTIPLSLFYSAKVLLAVFVSLFRRPAARLEEEP
jgi:glycosyltransferase involved in cell wall biosynthesis